MKLKVKEDFRKFKKDDEFELKFDFERKDDKDTRVLFLIGNNGCGKSTLMKTMRSLYKAERKSVTGEVLKGEMNCNLTGEIQECAKNIELTGFEQYEKVIALDGELDDCFRYEVCSSATDLFDNGGWTKRGMSNGTRSIMTYIEFVQNFKDKIVPGKTLVLLDEVDRGWQIEYCSNFIDLCHKHFPGCDVIAVSHNVMCWIMSDVFGEGSVYDIEAKETVKAKDYLHKKTHIYFNPSFVDKDEIINHLRDRLDEYTDKYGKLEKEK